MRSFKSGREPTRFATSDRPSGRKYQRGSPIGQIFVQYEIGDFNEISQKLQMRLKSDKISATFSSSSTVQNKTIVAFPW